MSPEELAAMGLVLAGSAGLGGFPKCGFGSR